MYNLEANFDLGFFLLFFTVLVTFWDIKKENFYHWKQAKWIKSTRKNWEIGKLAKDFGSFYFIKLVKKLCLVRKYHIFLFKIILISYYFINIIADAF